MIVLNKAESVYYFSPHDTTIIKQNCEGEDSEVVGRAWSGGGKKGARPHADLVACVCQGILEG